MNTTKTAQFTPGPWTVQLHNDLDTGDIRGANNEEIAICYMPDATLIAAAPAMYQALKALVDVFPSVVKMTPYGVSMDISKLHDNAKAVLSQAEGR